MKKLLGAPADQKNGKAQHDHSTVQTVPFIPSLLLTARSMFTSQEPTNPLKTSYLLDLFDHDGLRQLFAVKVHNTSENTAVPLPGRTLG